jgi:hypothetical protein
MNVATLMQDFQLVNNLQADLHRSLDSKLLVILLLEYIEETEAKPFKDYIEKSTFRLST